MKTRLDRRAWFFSLLMMGSSCGGESSLWVKLKEWPAGAEQVNVIAWLDGIRYGEFSLPETLPGFVVALPEGRSGELHLQLSAVDVDRCKVGAAEVTEALGRGLRSMREYAVQVQMHEVPLCQLSLELPSGVTSVRSDPAGLLCPTESGRCEADFPKGSEIKLEPKLDRHAYKKISAAGANCTEEGSCSIRIDKSKSSRFELVPRSCSPDGFCSYKSDALQNMLRGVWGTDENNVWAVGHGGSILKWNGSVWKSEPNTLTEDLLAIHGSDAGNIWAVGANGTILRREGKVWSKQVSTTTQRLSGVFGIDKNNAWAVGYGPTVLKWDGTVWTAVSTPAEDDLNAIWGNAANNIWAVGDNTTVIRWNGILWSEQPSNTAHNHYSVGGIGTNQIWTGGPFGLINSWNGTKWIEEKWEIGGPYLDGMWASDAKNIWAVGTRGTILKRTAGDWTPKSSGSGKETNLRSIWGSSAADIWVVGSAGTILRFKQ